jgi:heme/copper-type cytochrome/quinol oxidase subunit 2
MKQCDVDKWIYVYFVINTVMGIVTLICGLLICGKTENPDQSFFKHSCSVIITFTVVSLFGLSLLVIISRNIYKYFHISEHNDHYIAIS